MSTKAFNCRRTRGEPFSDGLTCLSSQTSGNEAKASSNGNPVQIELSEDVDRRRKWEPGNVSPSC